ncbi:hypothetical protein PENANT_c003G02538 [Penicillium antarcticum]|uniref:DUF7962 domain-containing protein n=1 Tax=Penicillium antarcticum TaxID=416450 RepID=A0A1V6QJ18_9EURO|nr:hypothetical protein PENANT_c003G02538 [Penicillium antarcticum]
MSIQPRILPRPDLARLGVHYRRIPVLSIGRDIYLDSRLILQKLEDLAQDGPHFTPDASPESKILSRLFETLVMDAGLVRYVVIILLASSPALSNSVFLKDRMDLIGDTIPLNEEALMAARPEAINEVKNIIALLETTLLADGREWIMNTKTPSLADIEMSWPLHWVFTTPGCFAENEISSKVFPQVFGWVERLQAMVSAREAQLSRPRELSGEEAAEQIVASAYNESPSQEQNNSSDLQQGQLVELWPTDTGSRHKTLGRLIGLNSKELTVETIGDMSVRVHAPRHGFKVAAYNEK